MFETTKSASVVSRGSARLIMAAIPPIVALSTPASSNNRWNVGRLR